MDFSRGGDLIVLPISNYFRLFSFVSSRDLFDTVRASVGTLINKSGVKMTQNAPEQMFLLGTYCSCLLLPVYYTLTLHLQRANTFPNRCPLFRKRSLSHACHHYIVIVFLTFACIVIVDYFKNLHHHFCHRLFSLNAVNETSMKRSTEGSCIDQFYFEDIFIFWSEPGIALLMISLLWRRFLDQNIAANPRYYRGISQTGSFAICSDFYFIFLPISSLDS